MPVPVLCPGHASLLTFPSTGRLPSTVSAADSRQFCSRLHRYYAAVRLLTSSAAASSLRLPAVARTRQSGSGEMRSPRFRRVPFVRNGVSDHGRAVAPRMTVRNMLPSTVTTVSASARLSLSRLNIPLHMIAVHASQPPSPSATQHSLQGGALPPYPRRTFTGWNAPASPGALRLTPATPRSQARHRKPTQKNGTKTAQKLKRELLERKGNRCKQNLKVITC